MASQQEPPRQDTSNATVRSLLSAAIGLTSLATVSAEPSPNPANASDHTASKKADVPAMPSDTQASALTQSPAFRQAIKEHIMRTMPMSRASQSMAPSASLLPDYLMSNHTSGLQNLPLPPSNAAALSGFDSLRMPLNSHPASIDRVAAADRVATAATVLDKGASVYKTTSPDASQETHRNKPFPERNKPFPERNKPFPEILFGILSNEDHAHIISWLPHGKGFIINDKNLFTNAILRIYFDGAKFTSFTRRLKRWNFVRVPRGPELGAYYNPKFMRDEPELVKKIKYRMDDKFNEAKKGSEEEKEEKASLEEQIEMEMEKKVQEIPSSKKEKTQLKDPAQKLSSEEAEKIIASIHHPQGATDDQKMQRQIVMQEATKAQGQDTEYLPLPSSLPKRPSKKTANKTLNRSDMSSGSLASLPTTTRVDLAVPPRRHLDAYPDEWKLMEMEIERELLARSIAPRSSSSSLTQAATVGSISAHPYYSGASAAAARSIAARSSTSSLTQAVTPGSISNHPFYSDVSATASNRSLFDIERAAERIIEERRLLGQHQQVSSAHNEIFHRAQMPSSTSHSVLMGASARDLASRMVPFEGRLDQRSQLEGTPLTLPSRFNQPAMISQDELKKYAEAPRVSEGRAVMMSRTEEEEFAQYLLLKRQHLEKLQGLRR